MFISTALLTDMSNTVSGRTIKQPTFLTVSRLKGFPFGNCITVGNHFDKRLKTKQMTAETKHWNHAIKMGASMSSLSALSSVLFTNTVVIEITLHRGTNSKVLICGQAVSNRSIKKPSSQCNVTCYLPINNDDDEYLNVFQRQSVEFHIFEMFFIYKNKRFQRAAIRCIFV